MYGLLSVRYPVFSESSYPYLLTFATETGVFAAYALYTTQSQLKTFKKRCVSKPSPPPSSDAAVDRSTQDGSSSSNTSKKDSRMTEQILTMDSTAIRLETLEALARGINFDLRNAWVSFCGGWSRFA